MRIPRARAGSTRPLALVAALATATVLSACVTSQKQLLPTHGTTMADIWQGATTGSRTPTTAADGSRAHVTKLQAARSALRRPIGAQNRAAKRSAYTRTAANEIHSQFSRLPNPDLTLYIFPHLSGGSAEQVPVPGYTTIFPLYGRPHYGQPGERTEYQPVNSAGNGSD